MTIILLGLSALALGTTLIYSSWRWRPRHHTAMLLVGWLLLAGSVWIWSIGAGAEYGTVWALGIASVVAWVAVVMEMSRKARKVDDSARSPTRVPPVKTVATQIAFFLLIFLFGGAASILTTMGLSRLLMEDQLAQMAFVIIMLPVVWGLLSYLILYSMRLWSSLVMVLLAAVGGYGLMVL